jgi:hypothetical protein
MKFFSCQNCGHTVYFENVACVRCGYQLAYAPDRSAMAARQPGTDLWCGAGADGQLCDNARYGACNWLTNGPRLCVACSHNRTIPNIASPTNLEFWKKLETAKRYLFYELIRLGLPITDRLTFDFLADEEDSRVMTGHESGTITIALAEADDAERERRRSTMREPYRTLLGHFRHEIGHYYWDLLVTDPWLEAFRTLFGDERGSYEEALRRYYEDGATEGWQDDHVSAYATMHPWEDFAETWAQYLHIVDGLETTAAAGISVSPTSPAWAGFDVSFDPYRAETVEQLISAWVPASIALNMINRSMGQPDLYPFVISSGVVPKLRFVHRLVRQAVTAAAQSKP